MQQEGTHLIRLRQSYTCSLKNNFQSQPLPAVTVQEELNRNFTTVSGICLDMHTQVPIPDLPPHTEEMQWEPRPESYSCANSVRPGVVAGKISVVLFSGTQHQTFLQAQMLHHSDFRCSTQISAADSMMPSWPLTKSICSLRQGPFICPFHGSNILSCPKKKYDL